MKTMHILELAIAAAGLLAAMSFTNVKKDKKTVTQPFETGEFQAISVSGCLSVEYGQQPGKTSVTVTAPEKFMKHVEISEKEGTLFISTKNIKKEYPHIKVSVCSPELYEVKLSGGCDFSTASVKSAGKFNITASGASDFNAGSVECEDFFVSVSGAGDFEIDGGLKAKNNAAFEVSGAGDMSIGHTECTDAVMTVSGAGDLSLEKIDCHTLSATVNGSGNALLQGSAQKLDYTVSGAGNINAVNLNAKEVHGSVSGAGKIRLKKH